jgi:hypothetical protein
VVSRRDGAILIAGVVPVLFGHEVRADFITAGLPVQDLGLADLDRIATPFFPTICMNLRSIGNGVCGVHVGSGNVLPWGGRGGDMAFHARKNADSGRLMALFSGGFGRRLAVSSRLRLAAADPCRGRAAAQAPLDQTGRRLA